MTGDSFAGARVLVTGGSKGIGLACAEAFARQGAEIVLAARDADALAQAGAKLRAAVPGASIEAVPVDLSRDDERERLMDRAGPLDILVNNAGAVPGGDLFALSMDDWRSGWDTKVLGTVHLTKLALAGMRERRKGTVVNVIGDLGRTPRFDYVCGSTGNAALIAFTEAAGARSPDWNVRVFGVNPTATRTGRIERVAKARAQSRFGDETRWAEALGERPFGRLCEPSEVAAVVVALASPTLSYLSGTVVDLDGGHRNRG